MPKTIYLIRHGQTDYNMQRRMQGWLDIPLNDTGHTQAKNTAKQLLGHSIDVLYSSDLLRAKQTATHIANELGLMIKPTTALRERDMGVFSGWAWESEVDPVREKLWQEFEYARDNEVLDWKNHQGESIGETISRITNFLENLTLVHSNQSVALVTHGGTINHILEYYQLKSAKSGFKMINNAQVTLLTKQEGGYKLTII